MFRRNILESEMDPKMYNLLSTIIQFLLSNNVENK